MKWQQIPLPIRNAALWLTAFQFLAYLLCCLLQSVYAPIAEMSVLERLLGRIVVGNSYAPASPSFQSVKVHMSTMKTVRYSVV